MDKKHLRNLLKFSLLFLILGFCCWSPSKILAAICFIIAIGMGGLYLYCCILVKKQRAEAEQKREQAEKEKERRSKDNQKLINEGIYPPFKDAEYDYSTMIVIDTETTGTEPYDDEILQLAITDCYGKELFNHYFKPQHTLSWQEAESVNGISPQMVEKEKSIDAYASEIVGLIKDKVLVGYNVSFDADFLIAAELITDSCPLLDIMEPFARIYGEYSEKYKNYKRKKLTDCAAYYHYQWESKAHDALADCKATAYCFRKMCGRE